MKLIVGLGNPGKAYADTRHNAGTRCARHLARRYHVPLERRRRWAVLGDGRVEEQPVVIALPRTYVNESGSAVAALLQNLRLSAADLIVIYDDMDLPLGTIRIRPRGTAGGHRGVQSIIDALSTQEFWRVRVGIGRPPQGVDEIPFVLGAFTLTERDVMERVYERVADAVSCMVSEGIDVAMNRFNQGAP